MSMNDGYAKLVPVTLLNDTSVTATGWTAYVDLYPYNQVTFIVYQKMAIADASNFITPALYDASATPASSASYTVVGSDYYNGSVTAAKTTTAQTEHISYVGENRYVAIKLTETGTAQGQFTITAVLGSGRHQEIATDTPTTGTIT